MLSPVHRGGGVPDVVPSAAGRRRAAHDRRVLAVLLALLGVVVLSVLLLFFWVAVTLLPHPVVSCGDPGDCPASPQADEASWVDESWPDGPRMTRW